MNLGTGNLIDTRLIIDQPVFERNWVAIQSAAAASQQRLDEVAGFPVKTSSSKDLSKLFFEKFGLRPEKLGESGRPSFAADVLKKMSCPAAPMVTELKHLLAIDKIFRSTRPFIDVTDWTLTYDVQPESTTGRIYAENPAVTSFPAEIREAVIPQSGHSFIYIDYKAQELCIMAHIVGETHLLEDVHRGLDIFEGLMLEGIDRDDIKTAVYAYMYGATFEHISYKLTKPIGLIYQLFETLFARYPKLARWTEVRDKVQEQRFSESAFGSRYNLNPEALPHAERDEELRRAVNFIVQCTAAEILDRLVRAVTPMVKVKVCIFDALLMETPDSNLEETVKSVVSAAVSAYHCPLRVKCSTGKNWRIVWEAHPEVLVRPI